MACPSCPSRTRRLPPTPGREEPESRQPSPASSSTTSLPSSEGSGGLLPGLLHRLDLEDQLHLVAPQQAAGLERLVPGEAEVLPVDGGAGGEACTLAAPGIPSAAFVGRLQRHRTGDAMDRQVAGDEVAVSARFLHPGAAEGRDRILGHVEEI